MSETKEQITQAMERHGVPRAKAEEKYHSTVVGVVLMIVGCLLAVGSFGLIVLTIVVLNQEPGLVLIGLCGAGLVGGVYLAIVGGHRASGETMRAADEAGAGIFGGIAKLIRAWKGKNGGAA